jgi:hypothetical protein
MPLDDFRRQVDGEPISFDLLGHCADRYGVSLTAVALRWIEIAPKRAVLVASRDDHMLWAKSNTAAFKSGAFFATRRHTIELPREALAHSANAATTRAQQRLPALHWFPREPASMPLTEMTVVAGNYDYTLTLLVMPETEWQGARHDNEESRENTPWFTRKKNGRLYRYYLPVRENKEHAGASGLPRLPAGELEAAVLEQLRRVLRSSQMIAGVTERAVRLDPALDEAQVTVAMTRLDAIWEQLFPAEQQRIVRLLVEKVIVSPDDLEVRFRPNGIEALALELQTENVAETVEEEVA